MYIFQMNSFIQSNYHCWYNIIESRETNFSELKYIIVTYPKKVIGHKLFGSYRDIININMVHSSHTVKRECY